MKNQFLKPVSLLCCFVLLASCQDTQQHLKKITAKTIAIDSAIAPKADIDSLIAPYKNKLTAEMQQVYCYAPKELTKKDGDVQSSLGNVLADMCFEMAAPQFKKQTGNNLDFVLFNHGGIRAIVPAGDVTKEHAYKLMPFENELVVTTLSGAKVEELIHYFIKSKRAHPLSKQIALAITGDNYTLSINGKPFDKNASYHVLTSDYLQHGGDNMTFFKTPEKLTNLNYKFRDAIIDYFIKVDTLQATLDNRVSIQP